MLKLRTVLAFGAGAAAVYFLDPAQGARRREAALRKVQGEVAPQARDVVRSMAEKAPQITTLHEAGDAVRRVAPKRRPPQAEAAPTPQPAPGSPPPISES